MHRLPHALAAVALAAALAAPAGAAAQESDPAVATSQTGFTVVAAPAPRTGTLRVQVAGPDGRFGAALVAGRSAENVRAAVGPRGDVVVTWERWRASRATTWAAFRPAGGRFGPPRRLASAQRDSSDAAPAVDASGTATVATIDARRLVVDVRTPSGRWLTPQRVAGPTAIFPRLAVAANGRSILGWREDLPGGRFRTVIATRDPGQTAFAAPAVVAGEEQDPDTPVVATNDAGDAVVAWSQNGPNAGETARFSLRAIFRPRGGGFGPPVELAPTGATTPAVAVGDDGAMVLAWRDNQRHLVDAQVRTADGVLHPPVRLSQRLVLNTLPAVTAAGGGVVAWQEPGDGRTLVRTARVLGGGSFSPPRTAARLRRWVEVPRLVTTGAGPRLVTTVHPGARRPLRTVAAAPVP